MKLTATEVRDWLETVATGVSIYLAWRWRPKGRDRRPRHHVIELNDSVKVSDVITVRQS
jgi:hypothetical protein